MSLPLSSGLESLVEWCLKLQKLNPCDRSLGLNTFLSRCLEGVSSSLRRSEDRITEVIREGSPRFTSPGYDRPMLLRCHSAG